MWVSQLDVDSRARKCEQHQYESQLMLQLQRYDDKVLVEGKGVKVGKNEIGSYGIGVHTYFSVHAF